MGFDLDEFKKIVKRNQKAGQIAEKKSEAAASKKIANLRRSRYRLNASEFYQNFTVLCEQILAREKLKLGISLDTEQDKVDNNQQIIPEYFQEIHNDLTFLYAIAEEESPDNNHKEHQAAPCPIFDEIQS